MAAVLTHRGGERSEIGADTDLDALVAELDGPDDVDAVASCDWQPGHGS